MCIRDRYKVGGFNFRGSYAAGFRTPELKELYTESEKKASGATRGFESTDTKEFDLTLGYSIGGFSVSVTDYWFNTQVETGIDLSLIHI